MSDKDKIKRIKTELKNFNSSISRLKEYKTELNIYSGQEETFKNEIRILNYHIKNIECNLKIIKISLSILSPIEQTIITEYYFAKKQNKNIALQLDFSENTIYDYKNKALEKLCYVLYEHLSLWDDIGYKYNLDENKRSNSVYQYDLEGKFIKKWQSAKECESECGLHAASIRDCCSGRYKTYRGYKWSYVPLQVNKNI